MKTENQIFWDTRPNHSIFIYRDGKYIHLKSAPTQASRMRLSSMTFNNKFSTHVLVTGTVVIGNKQNRYSSKNSCIGYDGGQAYAKFFA